MAVTVTYSCDRCEHSQTNPEQPRMMRSVIFGFANSLHDTTLSQYTHTKHQKMWCDSCLKEVGLIEKPKKEQTAVYVAPTFEEMLREIMREEIQEAKP